MRCVEPATRLRGRVRVPGDKSASHRAVLLAALAEGSSHVTNLSPGEDVGRTMGIVTALGARVESSPAGALVVGPSRLAASPTALECGNSGTTMRLVAGMAASIPGTHRLVGDASLSQRPMDRVAIPLREMGARVEGQGERCTAPLVVEAPGALAAIDYAVPVPSAQVKSAILLAGLGAEGPTTVTEAVRTRATTETMLAAAGVRVETEARGAGRRVRVWPGRPRPHDWSVPGDPSQAAFFVVLAAVHPDAHIEIPGLADEPERLGFLAVLERMGADLVREHHDGVLDVVARSSTLLATTVDAAEIPSVDEVPALVVAAAAARGVSAFRDVGELRIKESDRFRGSLELAEALGCRAWSEGDDLFIEGRDGARFADFTLDAALDHRRVMASAVAAVCGRGGCIAGDDTVATSFPSFFDELGGLT